MFRKAFKKLEPEEALPVLQEINPKIEGAPYTLEGSVILSQSLPFYDGYKFFEVTDHAAVPARTHYIIYKTNDVTVINWTNLPIYALNARIPIKLDADNVSLYVRFFFTYVRGRHGRFLIAENVDDINWKEEPPPSARKAISKMLEPVHIIPKEGDDTYTLLGCMMFKDSLFRSKIHVKSDGLVSLSDEELLVEDMPVLDDTLGL